MASKRASAESDGCSPCPKVAALTVIRVAGDGDCLFHALGLADDYDGNALRIEVADFMEAHAHCQPLAAQLIWTHEAGKLRASRWAGHTAATAYSLLKQRRVFIHVRQENGSARVEDATHSSVSPTAPLQHVLYNGVDHYDGLVEMDSARGLVPAWEQPPPPKYLVQPGSAPVIVRSHFPPLGSDARPKPASTKFTAARPSKKAKAKAPKAAAARSKPEGEACPANAARRPEAEEAREDAACDPKPEPACEKEEEKGAHQLWEDMADAPVQAVSPHPHRRAEDLIKAGQR